MCQFLIVLFSLIGLVEKTSANTMENLGDRRQIITYIYFEILNIVATDNETLKQDNNIDNNEILKLV